MGKIFKKENIGVILTFTAVFGVSCFAAYSKTQGRLVKSETPYTKIDTNDSYLEEDYGTSYFNDFVGKMMGYADENVEESLGLKGTLNNFAVTYPSKDGLSVNTVKVGGEIDIMMNSLTDLDLSLDLDVSYNGKKAELALGLIDNDIYFALDDFKVKSTYSNTTDVLDYVYGCFFDTDNENGLGIDLDLEGIVDDLVGGVDLSGMDLSALSHTEREEGDNAIIGLNISGMALEITVRKTDLALVKVDLGTINLGDVTICGAIDFDVIDKVLKLDDPLYPKQRGEFVEVISYIGWADDLLDLFQSRTLGLDLNAQINLINDGEKSLLADINSKIDLNCADVFDFNNLKIRDLIEKIGNNEFNAEEMFNLDNLEFGIDLQAKGQQDDPYANVNLSFFENGAYLTLNENEENAVMRAKISNQTLSEILDTVPNLVSAIEGLSEDVPEDDIEKASDDIFGFITSSELVKGIKNNDFSGILDCIKRMTNDGSKIYLDLDLSTIGLGDNAEVNLVLDSSREETAKVLSLNVKDVVVSSVEINLSIVSSDFSGNKIEKIKANKDKFDDLSFVPGIINQASDLLNEKTGKLTISGTILDENSEGLTIDGVAQYDANTNIGYGSINMRERSSKIVNPNKYLDHKIDFDINNNGEENSDKNAYFVYNSELKAKITLQTFVDVFNLAKDLLNSDDERFTKFSDLLGESLLSGTINEIIDSKDYLRFAESSIIKSIKQESDGNVIRVVVSGEILGMDNDINVCVNFKNEDGAKKPSGLSLSGINLGGKEINVTLGLEDYDYNYASPVDKTANFMDFSQVRVLLDFGINTTKINYYHLTAKANLNLSILTAVKVDLDFHIHVDGKKTRVYGSIPSVPWLSDIASGHIATTKVSSELVFEPTEDVGGVFHIVRNEDHLLSLTKDNVIYYQSDSDNFVENIIQYLLVDMLDLRTSISDLITDSSVSTEKAYDPNYAKMFTKTGFKYSKNQSTGVNTWSFGLNMDQLLGNDTLGALEATLYGKDSGDSGLFTNASISLDILSFLTVEADITLDNPSFDVETWPSSIENKYNKVLSWYNNLSASKKADFDSNYKNKPLNGYTVLSQRNYF